MRERDYCCSKARRAFAHRAAGFGLSVLLGACAGAESPGGEAPAPTTIPAPSATTAPTEMTQVPNPSSAGPDAGLEAPDQGPPSEPTVLANVDAEPEAAPPDALSVVIPAVDATSEVGSTDIAPDGSVGATEAAAPPISDPPPSCTRKYTHHSGFGQTWSDCTPNGATGADEELEAIEACNLAFPNEAAQPGFAPGCYVTTGCADFTFGYGGNVTDPAQRYVWTPSSDTAEDTPPGNVFNAATFHCSVTDVPVATWD